MGGGGGEAIFEPKHSLCILKRSKKSKNKKKIDRAGIRTHNLRVRNPLGSTLLYSNYKI